MKSSKDDKMNVSPAAETLATPTPLNPITFDSLGLSETGLTAIKAKGFNHPTPIQAQIIPLMLSEEVDLVGQAQTGTGKTAAFALPLLDMIKENSPHIQVLVLVPTRELALQVCQEIESLRGNRRLKVVAVYGGQSISQQIGWFRKGVDIVVGTPGRIIDHIERKSLKINEISHVVLDEADEMLNMGFVEDIETILKNTPEEKRVLLFSATMPPRILSLAKNYMKKFKIVKLTPTVMTTKLVQQSFYRLYEKDKFEVLCRAIDKEEDFFGIVFCRTKMDVDDVARMLEERGYKAQGIHGDVSQNQREKILHSFRKRKIKILVATDVAARGIDIQDLGHVINFTIPQNPETYVHRIGRTGRSGKNGHAISLVTREEMRKLHHIRDITGADIKEDQVPSVQELLNIKKGQIKVLLQQYLGETPTQNDYLELAQSFLKEASAEDVLSKMLQYIFKNELNPDQYQEVTPVEVDRSRRRNQSNSRYDNNRYERPERGNERNDRRDRFDRNSRNDRHERNDRNDRNDRFDRNSSERRFDRPAERGNSSSGSKVRLYIGQGKSNGLTPKKLVQWISEEANIQETKIREVQVYDNFSFISIPGQNAEDVIKNAQKNKIRVEIAK